MIGKLGSLSMYLPRSVTESDVPDGFLEPATDYNWEVLAIERERQPDAVVRLVHDRGIGRGKRSRASARRRIAGARFVSRYHLRIVERVGLSA